MQRTALRSIAAASAILACTLLHAERRPRYGGILRIEMQSAVATLDPAQPATDPVESAAQVRLAGQVYETLVRLDDFGEPQPLLATGWVHDVARRRWVFTPRPYVTFHNGAAWEPAGGAIYVDDRQPIEEILRTLAQPRNAVVMRNPDGTVAGTGPFRLAQWDAGKSARLEANETYWGGRPYLDQIEFRMGRTPRDQALDLELGKADVVELSPADVRRAQQRGGKLKMSAPIEIVGLLFDRSKPEMPRLRDALSLSVDRSAILTVLLQKQGEISGALLPQWLSGYAFLFSTARDLARARQLVAPTQTLSFAFDRQDPLLRSIAERIILNASEAGLTLRAVPAPTADVRLMTLRVMSLDAREALEQFAGQLQVPPPASAPDASLYDIERALIESAGVVPLFQVPAAWQLSPAVHNWGSRQSILDDRWALADVWVETQNKP